MNTTTEQKKKNNERRRKSSRAITTTTKGLALFSLYSLFSVGRSICCGYAMGRGFLIIHIIYFVFISIVSMFVIASVLDFHSLANSKKKRRKNHRDQLSIHICRTSKDISVYHMSWADSLLMFSTTNEYTHLHAD